MASKRVTLGFPSRGLHRGVAFEDQPDGTTAGPLRNVRPRDWKFGGRRRGAQRPGLALHGLLADGCAVRSLAAMSVLDDSAAAATSETIASDSFARTPTLGTLGDFDGAGSDDYVISTDDPVSATCKWWQNATQTAYALLWSGNTITTTGTVIGVRTSGAVDTNERKDNTNNTDASANWARPSAAYFLPDNTTEPTDNFRIKATIRVGPAIGGATTVIQEAPIVALFCCGDSATATGGTPDNAFFVGLRGVNEGGNDVRFRVIAGINDTTEAGKDAGDSDFPSETSGTGFFTTNLAADEGSPIVMELEKIGSRVDFYVSLVLNGITQSRILAARFPNITVDKDGTASEVDISQTEYGFVMANVRDASTEGYVEFLSNLTVETIDAGVTTIGSRVAATCDGDVYVYDEDAEWEAATAGTNVANANNFPCLIPGPGPGATSSGGKSYMYLVDGASYNKIDMLNKAASAWTASSGSLPESTVSSTNKARFGVQWDRRVWLSGVAGNDDNIYGSKQDDWDNWNTTPATLDGTEAVTARIPAPVTCLAPANDDVMVVGALGQLWAFLGNPASGGQLVQITDRNGIVGPYAWARDDRGNLFFVDVEGLYVLPAGARQPQPVSRGRLDQFFQDLDNSAKTTRLLFDRRRRGLHLLVSSNAGKASDTHLWWDDDFGMAPFEDTWKDRYGPAGACVQTTPNGDRVLIGGWDGRVRVLDDDTLDDDGLAIDAVVQTTQMAAGGLDRVMLDQFHLKLGDEADKVDWAIVRSEHSEDLADAAAVASGKLSGSRVVHRVSRMVSGAAVAIRMSNSGVGERFSVERLAADVEFAGEVTGATR